MPAYSDIGTTMRTGARRPEAGGARRKLAGAARRGAPALAGLRLRLLVLAVAGDECASADLDTGAFLRARSQAWPRISPRPFDMALADVRAGEEVPDPARPETVYLGGLPAVLGRPSRRRVRRFLDPLTVQRGQAILGFQGPSIPYWTITGTSPSLALLKLDEAPELFVRATDGELLARLRSRGVDHLLPVDDPGLAAAVAAAGGRSLTGPGLENVLGGPPAYVLVALSLPRAGHCYKVVAAVLPEP